jgi:hypothetical protein
MAPLDLLSPTSSPLPEWRHIKAPSSASRVSSELGKCGKEAFPNLSWEFVELALG